jgi:hypothetical protein
MQSRYGSAVDYEDFEFGGPDPRTALTGNVDVDCPRVRNVCVTGFIPVVGFTYFYSAWLSQNKLGHKHLQHKFMAPALMAVLILMMTCYCWAVCRCWNRLASNVTCFVGCPIYGFYIWCVAFVTFVPDYDWMTFSTQLTTNLSIIFEVFSMLSESLLQIAVMIIVFVYRDRIFQALGIEQQSMVRAEWRDLSDPTFREREYIAVKVALTKLTGNIPAKDAGSMSNDLFINLQLGANENANTRVHNRIPAREGSTITVAINEVLQLNLPKDRNSSETLNVRLMDQDVVENDEIAVKVLTVREIYDKFFTPGSPSYSVDTDLIVSTRGVYFMDANGQRLSELDAPVTRIDFMFVDEGDAVLGLCVLPADQKAMEHLRPGAFGSIGASLGSMFAAP